jgi:site-specific recombinase XerD
MEITKKTNGELRFKEKVRLVSGKILTKTFRRKTDAVIWKRKVETEKTQGSLGITSVKKIRCTEIADSWFKAKVENFLAPRTVSNYAYAIKSSLVPLFGEMTVDKLTQHHINQFKNDCLEEGLSPKTINGHLTIVNQILEYAIDGGYIQHKPYRTIGILPYKSQKRDFYTQEEVQKLLNANYGQPIFPILILAFNTGARRGELLGLKWDRVNFTTKHIEITRTLHAQRRLQEYNKVNRDNFFPMHEHLEVFFRKLKKQSRDENGFVFTQEDGQCYEPNHFSNRMFRAACERAEVRYLRVHDIRHSYASHFVMNGGSIHVLQKLLGHSQIRTTEAYSHLSNEFMREASNVVSFKTELG